MRETCARVLAAASMMGAIAAVVAMSALFDPAGPLSRPIAAPPSALHRSVALKEQSLRPRPRSVARPEAAAPVKRPTRPVILTRSLVVVRAHRADPPARRLASVKPKHKPVTAPAPPQPAAPPPPAPPAAAAAPSTEAEGDQKHKSDEEHGNGHGHESDKSHKGDDGHED